MVGRTEKINRLDSGEGLEEAEADDTMLEVVFLQMQGMERVKHLDNIQARRSQLI